MKREPFRVCLCPGFSSDPVSRLACAATRSRGAEERERPHEKGVKQSSGVDALSDSGSLPCGSCWMADSATDNVTIINMFPVQHGKAAKYYIQRNILTTAIRNPKLNINIIGKQKTPCLLAIKTRTVGRWIWTRGPRIPIKSDCRPNNSAALSLMAPLTLIG